MSASTHSPVLKHHFDNLEQQHSAERLGMWMFLAQEIMFFGGLFTAYLVFRSRFPMAFAAGSNHLDAFWGGLNTLVLIVSSLTMALTVYYAQKSNRNMQMIMIVLTMFCARTVSSACADAIVAPGVSRPNTNSTGPAPRAYADGIARRAIQY